MTKLNDLTRDQKALLMAVNTRKAGRPELKIGDRVTSRLGADWVGTVVAVDQKFKKKPIPGLCVVVRWDETGEEIEMAPASVNLQNVEG